MGSNKLLLTTAAVYAKGLIQNVDVGAAFADCGLSNEELEVIREYLQQVGESITTKKVLPTTKEIVETYGK